MSNSKGRIRCEDFKHLCVQEDSNPLGRCQVMTLDLNLENPSARTSWPPFFTYSWHQCSQYEKRPTDVELTELEEMVDHSPEA